MSRARLLIVDDSQNIRDVLRTNFDCLGYDVKTARNGAEALTMVQQEKPDVLILDVMMPQQNGYQVCRRIKTNPALSDIPIVFLSAKGRSEDRFWGKDCGAEDYLTKPFSTAELEQIVERLARQREDTPSPIVIDRGEAAEPVGDTTPILTMRFNPRALNVFRQKYGEPRFAEVREAVQRVADRIVREDTGREPLWLTGHRSLRAILPEGPVNPVALCMRIDAQVNLLLRSCYDPLDSGRGYVLARRRGDARVEQIPLLSLETTLSRHGARKAS